MDISSNELFGSALRLREDGQIEFGERFSDKDWTLGSFRVETNEDVHSSYWQMHPAADEAVSVLAGVVRLFLRPCGDEHDESAIVVKAGSFVIVPRGRWHRMEVYGPSELVCVTVRHGTRSEGRTKSPGDRTRGADLWHGPAKPPGASEILLY